MVNFDMPYSVSGVTERNYHGTGVIVDAERGLVVIDRNTVPIAHGRRAHHVRRHGRGAGQGRVRPSAAQSRGRFLRSEVDRHDAGARGYLRSPSRSSAGDDVWVVGQRSDSKILSQKTQISSVDVLSFPLSRTLRFRDSNLEAVEPRQSAGRLRRRAGGRKRRCARTVVELRLRDAARPRAGQPRHAGRARRGDDPAWSTTAALFARSRVRRRSRSASARELGLPDEWVRRFEEHDPQRRQVLGIDRLVAGSPARGCWSPAICCWPSTARWSIASARSSAPCKSPESR